MITLELLLYGAEYSATNHSKQTPLQLTNVSKEQDTFEPTVNYDVFAVHICSSCTYFVRKNNLSRNKGLIDSHIACVNG